ncbi:MAG TPA: dihydrolipoyl dehydrogenase [Candidatus Nanoarchaeia archaeon]|nr:dihydrolipoyl dehydrogenase [uncultured archaeon]
MDYDFDLIVIGSGAGGGVGAEQAASLGKKVAVFENADLGGECPNWACVPTKALLHTAEIYQRIKEAATYGLKVDRVSLDYPKVREWKNLVVSRTGAASAEKTFKEAGIILVREKAEFISPHEVEAGGKTYSAEFFLIATGADTFVPPVEGLAESGYLTFREAVDFDHLPKSIFILGGGPIGCEFAQIFSLFGSQVFVADIVPRLLPRDDKEVGELIRALFEKSGVKIFLNCKVTKVARREKEKLVYYEVDGQENVISVEEVLVATGKKPNLDLGLEKAGVVFDKKQIIVNDLMKTVAPHIYAAGDVVGPYQFTHTGNYQSYIAVSNMFSEKKLKADYRVIPRCVFTLPEVASVGITEEEAVKQGLKIKKGIVATSIFGKANTTNDFNGFVKVITDEEGKILGASIVAARASEMIHELALAMHLNAKASDVASMIHAYPTFSEAIKVACANVE